MNKITYFIINLFISIFTIFLTLFINIENFYIWLIFAIVILFLPFILHILCKTIQVTKEQNIFAIQALISWSILILAWQNIFPQNNDFIIAVTQSLNKATEIQEYLTTQIIQPKMEIIPEEGIHKKLYAISVKNRGKKQNYKLTHQLLNSNVFDESVILNPYINYTKNRIKLLKRLKKECKNILYGIDGITWLEIKIVPPDNINDDNAKIKSITIRYENEENADSKKIKKQVENFINSLFEDYVTDIVIEDLTTNHKAYQLIEKAQNEFEKKNYSKTIEFVKEASKLNNNYTKCIKTVPQIVELERKIKNAPNDYQYYIELGDLLSSDLFTTSLYGNLEAIKNYEKALELNPNAQGIYEKIAQNYANLSMEYSIIGDFSTDKNVRELKK